MTTSVLVVHKIVCICALFIGESTCMYVYKYPVIRKRLKNIPMVLLHGQWLSESTYIHYWRRPLCQGPRALGKDQKALGKGFAECRPRQRALGKKINGKEALCRGPFVGHSAKPFPSANGDTRQRKAAVNGAAPLMAPLPSADS